jgi:hypothetical protein
MSVCIRIVDLFIHQRELLKGASSGQLDRVGMQADMKRIYT